MTDRPSDGPSCSSTDESIPNDGTRSPLTGSGSERGPAAADGRTTAGDGPSLVRDVLSVVAVVGVVVGVVAVLLFAVSGVWPPFVAIESGSMEPNANVGDLVFVVEADRYAAEDAVDGTGIVTLETARAGSDGESLGKPGDVIVFAPDGDPMATPVIHRAHFWVEEGENWVETNADASHLAGYGCDETPSCPAPHDGFVTKGDANGAYDQLSDDRFAETTVVAPDWIRGKAAFRIPWLGYVRLAAESLFGTLGPLAAFGIGWSVRG
ncbi:signal peptidase, endoplasmic reticulum-type [Halobiforma haloterrestris]|uniref:Signal peptidase, endoplasmic reticulum-type n=1 Tax=Natronobacterium haloterrestre TaxID=148448 RepID=A0A1I1H9P7_NATHA|nr:S26 family signal peptidase [Halobiforma haloterrestris]SFC20435.1 signal peptidase, endoplasmic reticulum-type [Halobiforma haloterrestris]